MKHYYSIANFAVGTFTNIFNKFFYTETTNQQFTNQQLFGEFSAAWKGYDEDDLNNFIHGIKPLQAIKILLEYC